jgi:hypothetical protein
VDIDSLGLWLHRNLAITTTPITMDVRIGEIVKDIMVNREISKKVNITLVL